MLQGCRMLLDVHGDGLQVPREGVGEGVAHALADVVHPVDVPCVRLARLAVHEVDDVVHLRLFMTSGLLEKSVPHVTASSSASASANCDTRGLMKWLMT